MTEMHLVLGLSVSIIIALAIFIRRIPDTREGVWLYLPKDKYEKLLTGQATLTTEDVQRHSIEPNRENFEVPQKIWDRLND